MFNIVEFLRSYRMVGQIHPTNKQDESEPVIALLVPISLAIEEYQNWSGQDITKVELIKNLKENGVSVFNSIEDFIKVRDNIKSIEKVVKRNKKKFKRNISEERRNQLKEHAKAIREKIDRANAQSPNNSP